MTDPSAAGDDGRRERLLTVVNVRAQADYAEVMFVESARIFRLPRSAPGFDETLRRLQQAVGSGRPLRVRLEQPNGEIIERVE